MRRALGLGLVALCALSCASSCSRQEASLTQIVVAIDADEDVASNLTRVEVEIYVAEATQDDRPVASQPFVVDAGREAPGAVRFPFSVGILKAKSERFLLVVTGYAGNDAVIEQKAFTRFVDGEVRGLGIYLASPCYGQLCGGREDDAWLALTCNTESGHCSEVVTREAQSVPLGAELDAGLVMIGAAGTVGAPGLGPANEIGEDASTESSLDASVKTELEVSGEASVDSSMLSDTALPMDSGSEPDVPLTSDGAVDASSEGSTIAAGEAAVCPADPICAAVGSACASSAAVATCAPDDNGCLVQANVVPCSGGAICTNGACACPASTPDTCSGTCTNKLSDASHCGACGHSCRGGTCSNGLCTAITLASGRTNPRQIAVSSKGVYWIEPTAVMGVSLNGGLVAEIASSTYVTGPSGLAVTDSYVYYGNLGSGTSDPAFRGAVMRAPATGGGKPVVFAKTTANISYPLGVAVAAGAVYWLDTEYLKVVTAPESTGVSTFLSTSSMPGSPRNLALYNSFVYYGDGSNGVYKLSVSGGSAQTIVPFGGAGASVTQIAAQGDYVYWTSGKVGLANAVLYRAPNSVTGATPEALASGLAVTPALAADASGIYWNDGNVRRMPVGGGASVTVASGESADFIALDAEFVYWTNSTSGTVKKVAK